jgi:hypothetical protein
MTLLTCDPSRVRGTHDPLLLPPARLQASSSSMHLLPHRPPLHPLQPRPPPPHCPTAPPSIAVPTATPGTFYSRRCHQSTSLPPPPHTHTQILNLDQATAVSAHTKPLSGEVVAPPPPPRTSRTTFVLRHCCHFLLRLQPPPTTESEASQSDSVEVMRPPNLSKRGRML